MDDVETYLEALSGYLSTALFHLGDTPVTTFSLIKLSIFVLIAFWVSKISRLGMRGVLMRRGTESATIYTLDRLVNYAILTLGMVVGLSSIGIDFTTFAVVAGALGVGIGLGLQPLVANFVSGVILLLDRSVKVGDFIELESGVTGRVTQINMRTTLVNTNDNVDLLIPNSELTTGRVVNWTLGDEATRLHIPFGVAYGTDKEVVKRAALEAAERVPEEFASLPERAPQLWFVEFGDSSLNFELLVWLGPQNVRRPGAVKAAYLWEIHSALERHRIEVPYPQRDLHVRSLFGLNTDEALDFLSERATRDRA